VKRAIDLLTLPFIVLLYRLLPMMIFFDIATLNDMADRPSLRGVRAFNLKRIVAGRRPLGLDPFAVLGRSQARSRSRDALNAS